MAKVSRRRGRYVLDYYDQNGERCRKTLPKETTLKKAKKLLRDIEDQIDRGIYIPFDDIPLFSKVAEEWIRSKKVNLRESTWSVYEGHTRNHFQDFDSIRINRITTARVEKFITERQKSGMNINTLRKVLVSLNQVFSYAVRHGYISYNPVRDAERPRGRGKTKKKEIRVLKPGEIKALMNAVENPKYRTLFLVATMSGARQGELLGLKWTDIDWINSQLHIERTFNNQEWYRTKTSNSERKIDLGPTVLTELKKWRLACPKTRLNLIFPNDAGGPINHNNMMNRYFFPALKAAGLPKIRFHDLRHTFASLLIDQGENIKYIQSQLGHSSPTVTLNVYAHLLESVNQDAARRLDIAVFADTGHKVVTTG